MNALVYDNVVAYSRLAISSSTRFPTHPHDHPLVPTLASVLPRLQRVCTPYTHTSHCISNYHTTSNGTTNARKLPTISLPHRFPNLCFSPLHDPGAAQDKSLASVTSRYLQTPTYRQQPALAQTAIQSLNHGHRPKAVLVHTRVQVP